MAELEAAALAGGQAGGQRSTGAGWRGRLARAAQWIEAAYRQPGSAPYQLVFDLTVFLVMVSLLAMVLEGVPALEEDYFEAFFVIETVVVVLFLADYAGSVYYAEDRWRYVFSVWGLIDLLAILPYFLTFTNLTGIRAGRTLHTMRAARASRSLRALRAVRALRVLRVARVLKLMRRRRAMAQEAAGQGHEAVARSSIWWDFQFGLIGVCTALALGQLVWEWEEESLFWLGLGAVAAANLAARRWCLRRGHIVWSLAALVAGLAVAVLAAVWGTAEGGAYAAPVAIVTGLYVLLSAYPLEGRALRLGGSVVAQAAGESKTAE
jgi:ABC-type multidrug transport system fused ATPase/permease subunit